MGYGAMANIAVLVGAVGGTAVALDSETLIYGFSVLSSDKEKKKELTSRRQTDKATRGQSSLFLQKCWTELKQIITCRGKLVKVQEAILLVAVTEWVLSILLRSRRLLNKLKALRGHDLNEFRQSIATAFGADVEKTTLRLDQPHDDLLKHRDNTGLVNTIRAYNTVHLLLRPCRFIIPVDRCSQYTLTPIIG